MSDLLFKMAQAATEDKALFASYIQQYAAQKSLSWPEVAAHLQIRKDQLAKLALCSCPSPTLFNGGLMQVADYVGVERSLLKAFVAEVEGHEVKRESQMPAQLKSLSPARKSRPKWNVISLWPKQRGWVVAAVMLLMLALGAFVFAQPKGAAAATLVVNEGQATVVQAGARDADQGVIVPADGALAVTTGDQIFLTDASTAQLLLIDGSTIELAAGTEINVDELVIDDTNYRVHLNVLAGQTLSRVVTVLGVGDRFEISTPSSTASVRGTVFTVAYISANETFISCDEGRVEVTLEGQESQLVTAGMQVTAVVGQPLDVKSQQAPDVSPTAIPTATLSPTAVPSPTAVESEPELAEPDEPVTVEAIDAEVLEELSHKPEDIPGYGDELPWPYGPQSQVPGHTPDDVPGAGDPPPGEGEVPANENSGGNNSNNGNGGPPESVPGNTPGETQGNGSPPTGGGEPPGNANGNDGTSSGGNNSNNNGDNSNNGSGGKKNK